MRLFSMHIIDVCYKTIPILAILWKYATMMIHHCCFIMNDSHKHPEIKKSIDRKRCLCNIMLKMVVYAANHLKTGIILSTMRLSEHNQVNLASIDTISTYCTLVLKFRDDLVTKSPFFTPCYKYIFNIVSHWRTTTLYCKRAH